MSVPSSTTRSGQRRSNSPPTWPQRIVSAWRGGRRRYQRKNVRGHSWRCPLIGPAGSQLQERCVRRFRHVRRASPGSMDKRQSTRVDFGNPATISRETLEIGTVASNDAQNYGKDPESSPKKIQAPPLAQANAKVWVSNARWVQNCVTRSFPASRSNAPKLECRRRHHDEGHCIP